MSVPFTPELVGLAVVVISIAGATNGVAGFGFAIVGTMALATQVDPAVAVVFMIVPILSVNVSLVRDLSPDGLRSCGRRFGPLIGAALLGTVVGMAILGRVPEAPLRIALGLVTLAFVVSVQEARPVPSLADVVGRDAAETPAAMVAVGAVSGLLFGGTNVGVQLVAYVRSFDISHGLFVGVVALVFLGLNAVRVAAAGVLGLYPGTDLVFASVIAVVPAVTGVAIGKRLRSRIGERLRHVIVLGLLTVIGARLILGGFGIV